MYNIIRIPVIGVCIACAALLSGSIFKGADVERFNADIPGDRPTYRFIGPETYYDVLSKPGLGTATVSPKVGLTAGKSFTLDIVYTVGDTPLYPGDGIIVIIPYMFPRPTYLESRLRSEQKLLGGWGARKAGMSNGFTTFTATNSDVTLSAFCSIQDRSYLGEGWHLYIDVQNAALKPGESIHITYGDRTHGGAGASTYLALEYEIAVCVYRQLDWQSVEQALTEKGPLRGRDRIRVNEKAREWYQLEDTPLLQVHGADADRMIVTVPSQAAVGEPFHISLVPRDRLDNVADSYAGTVEFEELDNVHTSRYTTFKLIDAGHKEVQADIRKPGMYRLKVIDREQNITGISNPIRITRDSPVQRIYWGDLHCHTVDSDGLGTVSQAYRYARDYADLDFCAVSDHLNGLTDVILDNAIAYNEEGRFVTFSAFEHSTLKEQCGDIIFYFRNYDRRFKGMLPGIEVGGTVNIDEAMDIVEQMNREDILVIPHNHSGKYEMREGWMHPAIRCIETYSVWGNSEIRNTVNRHYLLGRPARTLQEALALGVKWGVMASGDGHSGRSGWDDWLRTRKAHRSGLVAAFSSGLQKEGLWSALWNRKVYGTSGARILLEFSVNGSPMGSIIQDSSSPRRIEALVEGTGEIQEIHIIKNGKSLHVVKPDEMSISFSYTDTNHERDTDYYYLRVIQKDSELAWSSPIWVEQ